MQYLEGCECARRRCVWEGRELEEGQRWETHLNTVCTCTSGQVICEATTQGECSYGHNPPTRTHTHAHTHTHTRTHTRSLNHPTPNAVILYMQPTCFSTISSEPCCLIVIDVEAGCHGDPTAPPLDACTSSPCRNGGTCLTNETTGFHCSCPGHTTGPVCDRLLRQVVC